MDKLYITILAGGMGKRMNSDLPKVLHLVRGQPMIVRLLKQVFHLNPDKILVVVGKYRTEIKNEIDKFIADTDFIVYVNQEHALGTGDAVKSTLPLFLDSKKITNIILNGDIPLMKFSTLKEIYYYFVGIQSKLLITAIHLKDPYGNGRIIMEENVFQRIVEEKDCDSEEKTITLINCGIYICNSDVLLKCIPQIESNNVQNEYYLTDLVKIYKDATNEIVDLYILPDDKEIEIFNVNTEEHLKFANQNFSSV